MEDVEDEEDGDDSVETYDNSDAEHMREQAFGNISLNSFAGHAEVQDQPTREESPIEFESIESDLKKMSGNLKGPLDDLENIDDINVLNEITQNMEKNNGTSCIHCGFAFVWKATISCKVLETH